MIKKIKDYFGAVKVPGKIEWVLLGVVGIITFLISRYPDIDVTTTNGINFMKVLLRGHPLSLYEVAYKGGTTITYDFPIFIIFGIWNIPLLIYQKFSGMLWNTNYFCLLWAKLLLVLATVGSIHFLLKIFDLYNKNKIKRKLLVFLFLSSPFFLMSICQFGGYDIISVFFSLVGIYYYLKDDNKKFILFFSIAISLKIFAFFIFIPLILLKNKNVLKSALWLIGGMCPLILAKLIYQNAPFYKESMGSFNNGMLERLFINKIPSAFDGISIFLTLFFLICLFCFLVGKTKINIKKYTIPVITTVYVIFELFVLQHPQWVILVVPYITFLIVNGDYNMNYKAIFATIFEFIYLIILNIRFVGVFNPCLLFNGMLFSKITNRESQYNFISIIDKYNLNSYIPILNAALVTLLIGFVAVYLNKNKTKEKEEKLYRWIMWIRILGFVPFILIMIWGFFEG